MKFLAILVVSTSLMCSNWAIGQTISGKVVDQSGIPKQGVVVVLENKRGQSVSVTSTTPSGAFDLVGIPLGQYLLKIFSGNTLLEKSDVTVADKSLIKVPEKIDVGTVVVK
jgi:hypothetical protein